MIFAGKWEDVDSADVMCDGFLGREGALQAQPLVDPVVVDGQDEVVALLQQHPRLLRRDDAVGYNSIVIS